jgi:hypothetical protein
MDAAAGGTNERCNAMKVRALFLGLLLCAAAWPAGARESERLTIRVSPAVAFAPANLIVRTMIQADAENRMVAIVAESPDFYRSSEIELDGDRAPRTTQFEFRSLPSGMYDVRATLLDASGRERAAARRQVNVIQSGTSR